MKIDAYQRIPSQDACLTPLYRSIKVKLAASGDVELIKTNLREVANSSPDIEFKDNRSKIVAALPAFTLHEISFRPRLMIRVKQGSKQTKNIVLDISIADICSIETHAPYLSSVIASCLKGVVYGSTKTLQTSFIFEYLGGPTADGFFFEEGKNEIKHRLRIDRNTETWVLQRFTNQSSGMNVLLRRRRFDKAFLPRLSTQLQIHASYSGEGEALQFKASRYHQAKSIYYADYMSAYDDGVISCKQRQYIHRYGMQRFYWRLNERRQADTLENIWRYVYLPHNLDYSIQLQTELGFLENALSTSYITILTKYMREKGITLPMMPRDGKPKLADILEWALLVCDSRA
ncbi:hypothetical protein BM527_15100 [Alteromonas sp. Mex14]|nr:hypothetical protein BM527_15100 [Alteromonas sp. Mex14]